MNRRVDEQIIRKTELVSKTQNKIWKTEHYNITEPIEMWSGGKPKKRKQSRDCLNRIRVTDFTYASIDLLRSNFQPQNIFGHLHFKIRKKWKEREREKEKEHDEISRIGATISLRIVSYKKVISIFSFDVKTGDAIGNFQSQWNDMGLCIHQVTFS